MAVKIIFDNDTYRIRGLVDIKEVWRIFDIESQKTDTVIFFYDSTLWNSYTYSYNIVLGKDIYKRVRCEGYYDFILSLENKKKKIIDEYGKKVWKFDFDECSTDCTCK
jgi:hypothetical protein